MKESQQALTHFSDKWIPVFCIHRVHTQMNRVSISEKIAVFYSYAVLSSPECLLHDLSLWRKIETVGKFPML